MNENRRATEQVKVIIRSLREEAKRRFGCMLDEFRDDYDACFLVSFAADPNTAYSLTENDRRRASELLYAMVCRKFLVIYAKIWL